MATNSNNMIRMSGMNSGLDTESIINALTANSKLKITKQNRQLLKYQATQEAYRDVISKMQSLKSKYFDILNKNSNLKGSTMWNQFAATTTVDGEEKKISGFSATTSIDSIEGTYDIEVQKSATQASLSGSSLSGGAKIDWNSFENGKDYSLSITVGNETKNITFTAGATRYYTKLAINSQLSELYGKSDPSAYEGDASYNATEGLVYLNNDGQFVSREGKGISINTPAMMQNGAELKFDGVKTGNNSVTFQVGTETLNVSFQTLERGYFDRDGENVTFDSEGNVVNREEVISDPQKAKLYEQVLDDYVESKKYDEYQNWLKTASDEDKEALKTKAFNDAEKAQKEKQLEKYLSKEYANYKKGLPEGAEALDIEAWKTANYDPNDPNNELNKGFNEYYYENDKLEEARKQYIDTEYEKYCDGVSSPMSKDQWIEENITSESGKIYDGYKALDGNYGYNLNKESWGVITYREYDAFKEYEGTIKGVEDLTFTQDDIVDHYNKSSLQNSIGAAEMKDGTKFSVEIDADGNAQISAKRTEKVLDGEGNPVLDEDGKPKTEDVDVEFSILAGKGSTNDFGVKKASTSVSQISNSTLISDLGVEANEDGKYEFTINDVKFSFDGDVSVKEMMRKVNASEANVKMTYSSLDNSFKITSNEYGVNSNITTEGDLLSKIGLGSTATYQKGTNLMVTINDKVYESGGNSITADGTTFSFAGVKAGTSFSVEVKKDYSTIKDTIKSFVEDYNKLIEDIYKYLDEKPDKDYYFLSDADKEDMDLSEKQEEKWESKAKLGLLYHDSTISSVMTKLRTSLMGSVQAADGSYIGLAQIGIKTSTDYKDHGKLVLDEDALATAIMEHGEDISRLFSDAENGIMNKFSEVLDGAVGTTGDRGTLINKAGLATGSSATDNFIYNQMKRITQNISRLEKRYEKEQDRLWKKYSSMESMLGTINSQSATLSSYFGGTM